MSEKGIGCVLLVLAAIAIIGLMISIQAFFIQLGWNYVVVNGLEIAPKEMTFKMAIVASLALGTIGSMFKATLSKSK